MRIVVDLPEPFGPRKPVTVPGRTEKDRLSTAFVPPALMPGWLQTVNAWNPITFLIEAIRPLMVSGYDWGAIGKALLALAILGTVLQSATLWAFRRLTA